LVRKGHIEYFRNHPDRCDPRRSFCAKSLADALPIGWERLAGLIPNASLHRHHLSGGSSQTLALGLLGAAATRGQGLEWLFQPHGPFPPIGQPVSWRFEYQVGFALLNERPSTTDIDFLVSGPAGVVAVEAKFTEKGLGRCGCKGRADGRCDRRILDDRPYWKVARDALRMRGPRPPKTCELSLAYQAVRNVAAAVEMTGLREACSFGLLYDERNPYFAGAGKWPGWAAWVEESACADAGVTTRAVAWQELIPLLPTRGRKEVLHWAEENTVCRRTGRPFVRRVTGDGIQTQAARRPVGYLCRVPRGEPSTSERRPTGRPRVLPEEVVARIALYSRLGLGCRAIATELNKAGIATGHGGRVWYAGTVRAVLRSRGLRPSPAASGWTPSTRSRGAESRG
jgi:hypothetical protein